MLDLRVIIPVLLVAESVWSYKDGNLIDANFFSNKIHGGNRRDRKWTDKTVDKDIQIPGFLKFSPKPNDLKLKRLIKKLGDDFNDMWMSIEQPIDADQNEITISANEIDDKLLKDYEALNMTLTDGNNLITNISDRTLELFKRWLLLHGTCTVRFEWTDIGGLFWPRWIRKGICATDVSCSWPPGMNCVATEHEVLHILRWNCRNRKRKGHKRRRNKMRNDMKTNRKRRRERYGGMRCRWIKIPYTINNKCVCSC